MKIFRAFLKKISLSHELTIKETKIEELEREIKRLLKINKEDKTDAENDYETRLRENIEKETQYYRTKIKNLRIKNTLLREKFDERSDKFRKAFEAVDEISIEICNYLSKTKVRSKVCENLDSEKINISGAIIEDGHQVLRKVDDFKKKYVKLIESDQEV